MVSTVFHYMFRPTWPSSGVQESSYIYFRIFKESASLPFFFMWLRCACRLLKPADCPAWPRNPGSGVMNERVIVMMQLPVACVPQLRSPVSNCFTKMTEDFLVVLLIDSFA
jgi:hypothetical protein